MYGMGMMEPSPDGNSTGRPGEGRVHGREAGVLDDGVAAEEETSRPTKQQMMVLPLFELVRRVGIEIGGGVERLRDVRFVGSD
ncbi:hypothetical protein MLD38_020326 [Melastoma candidum]|uniref:Uncharacterized protein n=1 Tax=Melastoma candidum TaxID=119954 RepID=A0ACB9QCK4_9MYRT|nr:hypothetical protein MLD38_020326 [Melastoma candidum]